MSTAIFGRDDWISRLRDDVARTVTSHGGLVLVSGEAGIGKTTLIGASIEHARSLGAVAAVGTCSSSQGTPMLWPWTQAFRALQRALGTAEFDALAADVGLDPTELGGIDDRSGPEFAFFDAVATLLAMISHRQPLVVVIEDLHWADATSVQLLEFLARHTWFERILVIGTYRDTEIDPAREAHRVLTALMPQAGTIQLAGLDLEAVGDLVHRVTGQHPPATFVQRLHHRSGGNPFFVEQTARLWASGHGEQALTPGVTDAVRSRLRPLPSATLALLQAAAVLGNPSTLRVLAAIAGQSIDDCSSALAAALTARLLRTTSEGVYEFVHDLVRETVLNDLDPATEARWHAAIVRVLDDHPQAVLPGQAAEHAVQAGELIDAERTVDLLVAAGRDANSRLDLPTSTGYYRQAAAITRDVERRALIRLDLAAEMHFAARLERTPRAEAVALLNELLDEATQRSPVTAARLALGLYSYSEIDRRRVMALLRTSSAALLSGPLPEADDDVYSAVVEHLAEAARADADDDSLSTMLSVHHAVLWRAGKAAQRQRVVAELQTVARRHGDRTTEQFAASLLWATMLEQNDPGYLEQYRAFAALASRYETPIFAASEHIDAALIAGFRGRFDEAWERCERGEKALPHERIFNWAVHYLRWVLHLRRGDGEQARHALSLLADSAFNYDVLCAAQAAEEGRYREALDLLERVDENGDGVPRILYDRVLALAAAGTGDAVLIDRARERLIALSGTWSVDLYGMELGGPIDLYLGMLETAAGHQHLAVEYLERAARQAEHLSSPFWAATAQLALIEALRDDDPRRHAVEERLVPTLADLDAPRLERRAAEVLSRPARPTERPAEPREGNEFRRDGALWRLGWKGEAVTLPHAKGLADLHTLITASGADISSADLLNPHHDPQVEATLRLRAEPVLDDTARQQYRTRLEELDELLDAAGLAGDVERRDALLVERTALIDELRAATRIGGRPRRLGDETERARKTVTARIRDALRKIDAAHPALGAHLRGSVNTGTFCSYRPSEPVDWRLR
ncbi:ATP-binding protein [Aeromicrobium phragmitis]|nr:AAA family ATPase [Aeromicrobium phragmitis]